MTKSIAAPPGWKIVVDTREGTQGGTVSGVDATLDGCGGRVIVTAVATESEALRVVERLLVRALVTLRNRASGPK